VAVRLEGRDRKVPGHSREGWEVIGEPSAQSGPLALGSKVRLIEASIVGFIHAHTKLADGGERWTVRYWSNGSRELVDVLAGEVEVVQ
jgi:hypothetical protein